MRGESFIKCRKGLMKGSEIKPIKIAMSFLSLVALFSLSGFFSGHFTVFQRVFQSLNFQYGKKIAGNKAEQLKTNPNLVSHFKKVKQSKATAPGFYQVTSSGAVWTAGTAGLS